MGLILLLAALSYAALRFGTHRLEALLVRESEELAGERAAARARTISSLIRNTAAAVIVVVAGIMLLDQVGLNIAPILAGVGIAGLAVGFGAQTLVRDVISGLFILLERQFDVGDYITTKGISGTVESVTLRATIVRDSDGTWHVIPNGEIRILSNRSRGWARAIVDVNIGYQESIDRAIAALQAVAEGLSRDPTFGPLLTEAPQVIGVQEVTKSAVTLRMTVRTLPGKQEDIRRELKRRIKERFDSEGIQIA
jgi:small conductance mechanosensitive channel